MATYIIKFYFIVFLLSSLYQINGELPVEQQVVFSRIETINYHFIFKMIRRRNAGEELLWYTEICQKYICESILTEAIKKRGIKMSIEEHEDYEKEISRLDETIAYIVRLISLVVDKRLKYRQDMREAFTELDDMDSSLSYANILLNTRLLDSLEQNFGLLRKSKDHPYFARMDIRQSDKDNVEEIYIGKISLFDESMETPLVVDWRAPISSVYYDGRLGSTKYSAYGEEFEIDLHLKRQYTIEGGELKHFVDVDISMSDTFLQATLENHASDKLKDIVSTIQAEQNDIIRADIHKPLIVQGVAGSGKTTIALHRIAYLIYTYSDSFEPEDFIIIAPNNLFLDYISGSS